MAANLVTHFKSNKEEYNKIKQAAYEEVKSVLMNGKLILKFAIFLVIESLRSNSELYKIVIYDNSNNITISYRPNYPSLVLEQRQQSYSNLNDDSYPALVLEEYEKLYNKLTTELTNGVMAAIAAVIRDSSLPTVSNNNQKLTYNIDNAYQTDKSRYNQNRNL